MEFRGLHSREHDLALRDLTLPIPHDQAIEELTVEILFDDHMVVAAGVRSTLSRRHKIDLAELVDEPWLLGEGWPHRMVSEAFRARGLNEPKVTLTRISVHLRADLVVQVISLPHFRIRSCACMPISPQGTCGGFSVLPWPIAVVT